MLTSVSSSTTFGSGASTTHIPQSLRLTAACCHQETHLRSVIWRRCSHTACTCTRNTTVRSSMPLQGLNNQTSTFKERTSSRTSKRRSKHTDATSRRKCCSRDKSNAQRSLSSPFLWQQVAPRRLQLRRRRQRCRTRMATGSRWTSS